MNHLIAKEPIDLPRFFASTTRNRIPITITRVDGSTVEGRIVVGMSAAVIVERPDGTRIKVRFGTIDCVSRPGGRHLWKRCV